MTDLFETPERLPRAVLEAIDRCEQESDSGCAYAACRRLEAELKSLGYEFDWDLDGVPYGLVDTSTA